MRGFPNIAMILLSLLASKGLQAKQGVDLLDRVNRVVDRIDYLPFTSIRDGCYARAFYLGMELTVHGIPASNQYAFGDFEPHEDVQWSYHVAPIVELPGRKKFAILDPAFTKEPMTRHMWVRFSKPQKKTKFYITPVSHYQKSQVQKMTERQKKGYSFRSRAQSVREVPGYYIGYIADACSTAYEHIGYEKLSKRAILKKRLKLIRRTKSLVLKLKSLGKLDEEATLLSCKQGTFAIASKR